LLVGAMRLVKRPLVIRVEVYAPKGGWGMVTAAVASRSARLVEEVARVLGERIRNMELKVVASPPLQAPTESKNMELK